jgi:hypothetical protein
MNPSVHSPAVRKAQVDRLRIAAQENRTEYPQLVHDVRATLEELDRVRTDAENLRIEKAQVWKLLQETEGPFETALSWGVVGVIWVVAIVLMAKALRGVP